ncbi:MAG: peptidoglycan endopeptidase [Lachnospiraceae bacterium]|nr:peptidoglycan endopeptidase [Lachnospiraceae bacterium]
MKKSWKTLVALFTAGLFIIQTPITVAGAAVVDGEVSLGGITAALNRYYESINENETDTCELFEISFEAPENLALANVSSVLNIRKKPNSSSGKVGILPRYGACIVESVENGWAKVTSGKVSGYVNASYLITGEEAVELAKEIATLYATVNSNVSALNIRKKPSTDSKKVARAVAKERLRVSKEVVVNKEDDTAKIWVEIFLNDDVDDKAVAYVSTDYVTLSYELTWATEYTPYGPGVSDLRVAICDYACQYIGTKYVWGGNSLTKGIDCSGLVQQVYKHFGYSTPRVSYDMASKFTKISISELQPGDLVFYGKSSDKKINHVGIYIGNNKIVHSSTNYKGVAISSMYFSSNLSILKCCRILDKNK